MTDAILAFLAFILKATIVLSAAILSLLLMAGICYIIVIAWKLVTGRFK